MWKQCLPTALALLAVLGPVTCAQGYYKDPTHGFAVRPPADWEQVPISVDEKWIAVKFLSDRVYTPKRSQYYTEHKPTMRVIVFHEEATKIKGPEVRRSEENKETLVVERGDVPYRDYKDYLKRNMREGFFFTKEEKGTHGKTPCTRYEIKIEKLTVPKRIVAWVFHREGVDYAVEVEMLEDYVRKLKPIAIGILRSFRLIDRDPNAARTGVTGDGPSPSKTIPLWRRDYKEWREKSATERMRTRKRLEQVRWAEAKKGLPDDWRVKESEHFLVLSHCDPKDTQAVVRAAEACRRWLDRHFSDLSDEYVMKGIIRVCADRQEAQAYTETSGDAYSWFGKEIITYKDASLGTRQWGDLYSWMVRRYLVDKDSRLAGALPPWLRMGIEEAVDGSDIKGGMLDLAAETSEKNLIREARRKNELISAKELMEMPTRAFFRSDFRTTRAQAAALVRWFLTSAPRNRALRHFLVKYMQEVAAALTEMREAAEDKDEQPEPETEEEEEKRFQERMRRLKSSSSKLIERVHSVVCNWSEKEWHAIERGYRSALQ